MSPGYLTLIAAVTLLRSISASRSELLREVTISIVSRTAFRLSREKRKARLAVLRAIDSKLVDERATLKAFQTFWRDFFECATMPTDPNRYRAIPATGLEGIDAALQKGRGCILLESNCFGRRNLAKQVLRSHGYSLEQLHREDHLLAIGSPTLKLNRITRSIRTRLEDYECQFVQRIHHIPRDGSLTYTRDLLRSLEQNQIICSAGDGRVGQNHLEIQFLNRPCQFPTGIVSLSRISGAPLLPLFCYEQTDSSHLVEICSPIEAPSQETESVRNALFKYAASLEERIRLYPTQYLGFVSPSPLTCQAHA